MSFLFIGLRFSTITLSLDSDGLPSVWWATVPCFSYIETTKRLKCGHFIWTINADRWFKSGNHPIWKKSFSLRTGGGVDSGIGLEKLCYDWLYYHFLLWYRGCCGTLHRNFYSKLSSEKSMIGLSLTVHAKYWCLLSI